MASIVFVFAKITTTCHRQLMQILLVFQTTIVCDHGVKSRLRREPKQLPVLNPVPFHVSGGKYLVIRQLQPHLMREILIQQQFHACTATLATSFRSISSSPTTCSRFTVENCARKPSMVYPASRWSKNVCAVTRVPAKQGAPCMIFG